MTWFRYQTILHPDKELRQDYFNRCGIVHENDMTAEEFEDYSTPDTDEKQFIGRFEIEFAE
tara:strand:+ start:84 stop:266 length:183 start_codon:yes stop_codon:yes gene_type:complete